MKIVVLNKRNILCFDIEELRRLFENKVKSGISIDEMLRNGISFDNLVHDLAKRKKLSDAVSLKIANDRDIHEVFAAIFIFIDFFENGSEVCFELNEKANPLNIKITSLDDLNKFKKDPPDFIIKSGKDFREFELKRYREKLSSEEILNFLKEKILRYADSGNMNYLIIIQSRENDISSISFDEISKGLKLAGLKIKGQVLISYNENNNAVVIKQVFPNLLTIKKLLIMPSQKCRNVVRNN